MKFPRQISKIALNRVILSTPSVCGDPKTSLGHSGRPLEREKIVCEYRDSTEKQQTSDSHPTFSRFISLLFSKRNTQKLLSGTV